MNNPLTYQDLNRAIGNIDIYLLDQILKGRFEQPMRVLDAGCGEGRNLVYFIRNGFDVWGIDRSTSAIHMLRMLGKKLHPEFDPEKFLEGDVADLPFPPVSFDTVICSAVLHFAENMDVFMSMIKELLRVLKPHGLLFIRTATDYGIENQVVSLGNQRYRLRDGSERFLVSRNMINKIMKAHALSYVEPFKTVIVDDVRSMCVLILQKAKG